MLLPALYNIAEICAKKGLKYVIISPGSRSAPLTLAFARHKAFEKIIVPDERSAAFMALGIAQTIKQTVILICTSGSATLNYAPAVAEAFFQEVPLLLLTADRPNEWIDQQDGQTIRQQNVFGKHVKASFHLPQDYSHPDSLWHINRIINEAINLTQHEQTQPVHVNVPIREPFYPNENEEIVFDENVRIIEQIRTIKNPSQIDWQHLMEIEENCPKQLIVVGQMPKNQVLLNTLPQIERKGIFRIPIVADIIANAYPFGKTISHQDLILMPNDENLKKKLQPDLLITLGKSVLSKSLKQFLRKYPPRYHWHFQEYGDAPDTFQNLTHILPLSPEKGLEYYLSYTRKKFQPTSYYELWLSLETQAEQFLQEFFSQNHIFNEFWAVWYVLQRLPNGSLLHLANSMPVRYANYLSLAPHQDVEVFANRGTSGIDGSNSTALGAAWVSNKIVTLITGDMAFGYDSNAFWQKRIPENLRIVVLNNEGGGIFRLLPESSRLPEMEEFFETTLTVPIQHIAEGFGLEYQKVTDGVSLQRALENFFEPSAKAKVLEIKTQKQANQVFFEQFKQNWLQKFDFSKLIP
ncbi:MAG: 2-succinyl-5-enolpyruvyl-6-hydroxy-3-cyclohexene-1-carboxylic-acid synthase [Raineya sp.]|nr:2-succinyl-5-enolpyruvyl-6-hydroxy-3-cyclohexene-1-carboxylic-acid synthase [Raineya sp.]